MRNKIIVASNNDIIRKLLMTWVDICLPGAEIIESQTGEEAANLSSREMPHLAVMDLGLSGGYVINTIRRLKELSPGTNIIVYTAFDCFQEEALKAGASDYIICNSSRDAFFKALRDLMTAEGRRI
ncbi:MAG: response regulator, partial [Candidatus Dadabacteria bacterium]